ncbi:MAG: cation:proton antiporter [Gemmatimonadaceae bacterium]|nr:cation:proton antiporter [Gemmatimonadaceae bacterium]
MHDIPILRDLVILVMVAVPVVLLAHRLRVPSLVGFLITGVAIGPNAFGLVSQLDSVNTLAEVGSVLLLFAIGLELSLSKVVKMGGVVLRGGAAQLVLTVGTFMGIWMLFGANPQRALLYGILVALSSTAIVLKVYADRGELDSAHGRIAIAILLFQDLCVVPLMLLMPILAGSQQGGGAAVRGIALTAVVALAIIGVGRSAVPWVLHRVVRQRNSELFTLTVLAIGLGAAFLTQSFGMSLALGAFLAGLIIAESEYGLQALSDVLPFRDAFSGIFFTSVGMLLDVRFFASHALAVTGFALSIVVLKTGINYLVVRYVRRSQRVGVLAGIGLAEVGEFSFVLASSAVTLGLLASDDYQVFLGASILTMLAAPFLTGAAPAIADWIFRFRAMPTMEFATREARAVRPLADHVIIVGYGLNGRNVARALRRAGIAYAVIESNGQVVRQARLDREMVIFGDGTRGEVLDRVGVARARVVVFCLAAANDERRAVAVARHLNPDVHIVSRTRYVSEIAELQRLGADEVVPEEFETSLEIFARVLRRYDVPDEKIRETAAAARRDHYDMLRHRGATHTPVDEVLGRAHRAAIDA